MIRHGRRMCSSSMALSAPALFEQFEVARRVDAVPSKLLRGEGPVPFELRAREWSRPRVRVAILEPVTEQRSLLDLCR